MTDKTYTAEQVEAQATWEDTNSGNRLTGHMLRAYAATLRQQAGAVDEVPKLLREEDGPEFVKPEMRSAYRAGWNDARTWILSALARPASSEPASVEAAEWQKSCPDYPNCPNLGCPCEPKRAQVSDERHNSLIVGPSPWMNLRLDAAGFDMARAAYGASTVEDDRRVYQCVQAYLRTAHPAVKVPDVVAVMQHLPDNRAATRCELIRAFTLAAAPGADGEVDRG